MVDLTNLIQFSDTYLLSLKNITGLISTDQYIKCLLTIHIKSGWPHQPGQSLRCLLAIQMRQGCKDSFKDLGQFLLKTSIQNFMSFSC